MASRLSGATPSASNRRQICLALKPMSTSIRQFSVVIRALFPALPLPRIASSNTVSFISQNLRHAKPEYRKNAIFCVWECERCPFVVGMDRWSQVPLGGGRLPNDPTLRGEAPKRPCDLAGVAGGSL